MPVAALLPGVLLVDPLSVDPLLPVLVEGEMVEPAVPEGESVLPLPDWAKAAEPSAVDAIKAKKIVLVLIVALLIAGNEAIAGRGAD